jgi:hypothetical protein
MVKGTFAALVGILCVAGCGGIAQSSAPTASSVSVQPGDAPKGMVKCDLSGSIDSFLTKEKTQDPNTYSSTSTEWNDAKKNGATAASVAFYADSASHCKAINTNASDIGSANYKLIINFVIQFKDESSAAKGYTSESIFGFKSSDLKQSAGAGGGAIQVVEGTKTGLSTNSLTLNASVATQAYYIAVWQNKAFMVILAVLNVDPVASKKVATSENGRIS